MFAALPPFIRLAALGLLCFTALPARIWTDTQGRTLVAEFVNATPTQVNVRTTDGRTLSLPLAKLCSEDLTYVAQQRSEPATAPLPAPYATPQHAEKPTAHLAASAETALGVDFNSFNTLLGMPLLADETLWDDSPPGSRGAAKVGRRG
jgi:hypothetical protein